MKLYWTEKIIKSLGLLSSVVVVAALFAELGGVGGLVQADSEKIDVYTEISKKSDPGWQRSLTLTDLEDEVKFKVNIKNLTAETLDDVSVKFEPASGLEFSSNDVVVIKSSGEETYPASSLVDSGLNIGELESSDFAEVIFEVKLSYCPALEVYRNGIEVKAAGVSSVVDQVEFKVDTGCVAPDIEKLVSNTERPQWSEEVLAEKTDYVQYKVRLTNPNPLPLTELRIKDKLPQGLTLREDSVFLSFSGDIMSPNPDNGDIFGEGYLLSTNFYPYDSPERPYWEITYKARVEDCSSGRTKVNEATTWVKWSGSAAASAVVTVVPCPEKEAELEIEKFVKWEDTDDWYESIDKDKHLFDPEELVEYKIIVKNNGNADANNVTVKDEVPTYISWEKGDGDWDSGDRKIKFDLGTVKAGETIRLDYVSKVFDEQDLPLTDRVQKNVATLYKDGKRVDDDHTQVWINGPEVKGVEEEVKELPEAGADSLGVLLIAVGMVITGWGLRKCAWAWSGRIS